MDNEHINLGNQETVENVKLLGIQEARQMLQLGGAGPS